MYYVKSHFYAIIIRLSVLDVKLNILPLYKKNTKNTLIKRLDHRAIKPRIIQREPSHMTSSFGQGADFVMTIRDMGGRWGLEK